MKGVFVLELDLEYLFLDQLSFFNDFNFSSKYGVTLSMLLFDVDIVEGPERTRMEVEVWRKNG
ncbi:hypothetical protein Lalb_Chr22g0358561 [Lupinus albus]|uniref:Uncharacterized protein n=1 Tax=Lupinus albus TaxID=3870 RepID=A0A6A4NMW9_LUPAL|nr:hypothetical protein Lalb_Chr22g0358561 [Lupinus albus]